ncbi:SfnB family sulfur acquisition oxidoreductase (plasmid) [Kovacikia minuta CCNUW1]|uniref:SfnB family sulfur acquisition oxidoreductase n=1 Tax=Kovacikia minuta TaxID=2931930 RepID=UPI001CCDABCB|nr:SfnB family sulfur acquisition oxidoreductase [Kovacikia minuta]UBF29968.1 SfnB family sulfur acquisition oxidoreductase [Kovacikia minuta CCNUW1]
MTFVLEPPVSARVIRSDAEAIAVAQELADEFEKDASERDRKRQLPYAEVQKLSQSGLLAITVPKEYGGAGVSNVTLVDVLKILSEGDSSLGQIPQNHLYSVEALRIDGTEAQKQFFFDLILKGMRFGNAFSERGTKNVQDIKTRLTPDGSDYVLNGQKFYSTGALFAHWIPVLCLMDVNGEAKPAIAHLERDSEGVNIIDDWSCFGQKGTGSGTTIFENARVKAEHILPHYPAFERPTTMGAFSQVMHAAVDVGIAGGALRDAIRFVRANPRPWIDAGTEYAYEDPLLIHRFGEMTLKLHAAEAILRRSGEFLDRAFAEMNTENCAAASIAVAEAKAISEEAAIFITNSLFEMAGTKSTMGELNLDRHWRNARALTVHDPSRWKFYAIGNYYLNNANPPRHGYI